jgi:hypothetical protein
VFSTRSIPRCYKHSQLAVAVSLSVIGVNGVSGVSESVGELVTGLLLFSHCEKLVVEAGDSSGTLRMGNARRWKLLPSSGY